VTRRPFSREIFLFSLAALVLFKIWLVQTERIVGSATQYDALWYLRSASHWYWGTPYDWTAYIRPCGYPLWIASVRLLHIPLRLAIELFQAGGGLTLIFALRRLGLGRPACVLVFGLLLLHPTTFQQNNYTMSDTFYAGLLWYVLGGLLLAFSTVNLWQSLATGIALAILWNTREEGILLLALVGVGCLLIYLSRTGKERSRRDALQQIAVLCTAALGAILIIYTANSSIFNSFARSEMTAPVFQSLYHSLLRIKPSEPKPYAPITMSTLHRAFAVSPTFARLRASLDGPLGEAWRVETKRRVGVANEIGAGWIVWATREAAAVNGIFASPKTARRFFTKAAQEINRACDRDRLPTRFVIGGFLDPLAQSGARTRLPKSTVRVAGRVFAQWTIGSTADDKDLTKEETQLYDRMTLRGNSGTERRSGQAFLVERWIALHYWMGMVLLHLAALSALALFLVFKGWRMERRGLVCALILISVAVFLRAILLVWLDATAFDATQDRFLLPILPLWPIALVLVIVLGVDAVRHNARHRPHER